MNERRRTYETGNLALASWQVCKAVSGAALMFLAFGGIFALVFSLYDLETEAVWYAGGLCLFLAAVVLGIHFLSYRRRHLEYKRVLKDIQVTLEELPSPRTLAEADLQKF